HPGDVLRIADLLVTEELRPRSVGRIGKVLDGSFALRMPAAGRLRRGLPEERPAGIRVAEQDHVAGEATSERASSRTSRASAESGSQALPSTCFGERPPSAVRSRTNHRRTPNSLYAPRRSPTTPERKCAR